MTIVLENQKLLGDLCGANDRNLRTIEKLIDEQVFSRGNELYILSEDEEKQEIFRELVTQLKEHTRMGHVPGPDLIESIYRSSAAGEKEKTDSIRENNISIPGSIKIFPKSYHQADYIRAMRENDIVFSIGPAGTGKTYLAIAYALEYVLSKRKNRLILTRPVVEAGENLGFLPGDLTQKISPYLRPLYDAMDACIPVDMISRLEENRIIEIAPLAYMRGRSINNSIIILDEAQNTTREQMKMFLTRIGNNSQTIVTGDVTQIDLPKKGSSGLVHARNILKNIPGIHFSFFDGSDVVRNPLIKKIIEAYEKEYKQ